MAISHKVRVYVFRWDENRLRFLLLRKNPPQENVLGPVCGPVGLDEHLPEAAVREVREETGLVEPVHLIDLQHANRLVIGDEGLVEWEFGYQARSDADEKRLSPGPDVSDLFWLDFDQAYARLEAAEDRTGIIRLRMRLQAG